MFIGHVLSSNRVGLETKCKGQILANYSIRFIQFTSGNDSSYLNILVCCSSSCGEASFETADICHSDFLLSKPKKVAALCGYLGLHVEMGNVI